MVGRLQEIINAKKLLEDEGYQSPRLKPTQSRIDGDRKRLMALVNHLAIQITEMNYGFDGYIDGSFELTDEAKEYYSERYDEYENLIKGL